MIILLGKNFQYMILLGWSLIDFLEENVGIIGFTR